MEDVQLGDGAVTVADAKLSQCRVGDVLAAVAAVFGVGVEGEAQESVSAGAKVDINEVRRVRPTLAKLVLLLLLPQMVENLVFEVGTELSLTSARASDSLRPALELGPERPSKSHYIINSSH
jgi:hypothetical protein